MQASVEMQGRVQVSGDRGTEIVGALCTLKPLTVGTEPAHKAVANEAQALGCGPDEGLALNTSEVPCSAHTACGDDVCPQKTVRQCAAGVGCQFCDSPSRARCACTSAGLVQQPCPVLVGARRFSLAKAQARLHTVEGLMKAQADMNTVVGVIRRAPDSSAASQQLQSALDLSPDQASLLKSGAPIWFPDPKP